MNNTYKLLGLACTVTLLTACQSGPREFNGNVGYQIESRTDSTATLAYTLATRNNQQLDEQRLQRACQKVLASNKVFKLNILSVNEIANPAAGNSLAAPGRQIGDTRATFSLSNTPGLHSSENPAIRDALTARPSTLTVVRYTCS